uniref:Uncharacterized protein n=2 Tax=Physcomitrium patens TaxID=3218 RepID=A0A2K1KHJ3_PHYPA|nr:uncharacterized protein LOC112283946 isoform X1 [Physcomitrium patens]PNR53252.1 hypothetical protein PHYPA_009628 [Physcomitrium patens]|eukprot:XP_024379128.1 uncharacterized protein LOC112283946 isoform X1 [Physcomitrella patens]
MALELPGFYFDSELNRYFPLPRKRGRSGVVQLGGASSSKQENGNQDSVDVQVDGSDGSRHPSVLQLLQAREHNSRTNRASSSDRGFRRQFLEGQAAHPQVWDYDRTDMCADGALQQLRVTCQTLEGEKEADLLILGGSSGRFELCGTTLLNGLQARSADIVHPKRFAPAEATVKVSTERDPPGLWSIESSRFSSRITAIKRLGEGLSENSAHPHRRAILTTLGDGKASGSLYVLSFKQGPEIQEWDRNYPLPFQIQARVKTRCSVYTAEANPNGIAASLGMDEGAGLVALERSDVTWLCRSSSDVLAQQFDKEGNVLFCGFRNGVISTIDLRKPAPKETHMHHEAAVVKSKFKGAFPPSMKYQQRNSHSSSSHGNNKQNSKRRVDDYFCSHAKIMRMGSAICSLLLLRNDENYLLASAMNGVIHQWDRRMVENGAVRTYEGHNNTHTTLQLGVDPTETLLVSGGEDCALRIWSLASGRLLHTEKSLTSPAACICWPASMRLHSQGGYWEDSPFESNFSWGFWFGSSTGLRYMHGAGSQL